MSALAQLYAMGGYTVTGSDRLLSKGHGGLPVFQALEKLNIKVFPQDGSAISKDIDMVVVSSAIEADVPELQKAKDLGLKIIHRSELLDENVKKSRTIAVSGTSGKSTVTAMVFEILTEAGLSPSVITGATLLSLQEKGFYGNVYKGQSDILVIEADESDGSLTRYHAEIGVCLNIQKDHKEIDALKDIFKTFSKNCKTFIANAEEENISSSLTPQKTFGLGAGDTRAQKIISDGYGSAFVVDGQNFKLNIPGVHNVQNALAAIAVAKEMGVKLNVAAYALSNFKGVYRRFNSVGIVNKVEVIDDFAHNPHKLSATLRAAQLRGKRVISFFQPHAFASIKLLKDDFIEQISKVVRPEDKFYLTEVYYPGGTIPEGVSAKSVYDGLLAKGLKNIFYDECRECIAEKIVKDAQEGDVIMVMGARDPSLTNFAKKILLSLAEGYKKPGCEECLVNICCMHYKK